MAVNEVCWICGRPGVPEREEFPQGGPHPETVLHTIECPDCGSYVTQANFRVRMGTLSEPHRRLLVDHIKGYNLATGSPRMLLEEADFLAIPGLHWPERKL